MNLISCVFISLTICMIFHPLRCDEIQGTIDIKKYTADIKSNSNVIAIKLEENSTAISEKVKAVADKTSNAITESVKGTATNVAASINEAAAKATADIQSAAEKEKEKIAVALAAIKDALSKIEGIAQITITATESIKKVTANTKTKVIGAIKKGGIQILRDVNNGVKTLNVVLEKNNAKAISDARDGAKLKGDAIQAAVDGLIRGIKRSANGVVKNTQTGINLASNDLYATRGITASNQADAVAKLVNVGGQINAALVKSKLIIP